MDRKKRFLPALLIAALALVAILGVTSYKNVFAQTPTPAAPGNSNPSAPAQPPQGFGPHEGKGFRGGPEGVSDTDLASALGITVDKLQAAYQTANTAALKEAVSKGLITQEQADQWAQNQQNGDHFPFFGPKGANSGIDYNALLAQALGITTDQLQAARTQVINTNLDNAVKNGTMTQAQADAMKARNALEGNTKFQDSMKSAYEAAVKQAVTDGVITQAQADALLAEQPAPFFGGHGFGGRGGHGGFGGPGAPDANPNNPTTPATPSTSGGA